MWFSRLSYRHRPTWTESQMESLHFIHSNFSFLYSLILHVFSHPSPP